MENKRKNLAELVQRNINSIWESKIIDHITVCSKNNKPVDKEYLNDLSISLYNMINGYKRLIDKYDLKIISVSTFKANEVELNNIPRRFKVILNDDTNKNKENEDPFTIINKYYPANSFNVPNFFVLYNAYNSLVRFDTNLWYKEPGTNDYAKSYKAKKVYELKNGRTVVELEDNHKEKQYLYIDENIDTLKKLYYQ